MALIHIEAPKKNRKTLILVDPYPEDNPYRMNDYEQQAIWFPKLSLPVIAAQTPRHWDVRILDESRDVVRPEIIDGLLREIVPADLLVGISTQMTCYTPRAYAIADQFRARGVKVVLGGTHATYCPEEAAGHADCVVKYEADNIWPQIVADFEAGHLKPMYEMGDYPTLEHYPHPRIDLLPQGCYMTNQCLQTTRGCHFDCEFCSVSPFNGKSSRRRSVEDVVAEIQRVKEWRRNQLVDGMIHGPVWHRIGTTLRVLTGIEDGSVFAFVDDLHNSNRDYCRKLWTALKALDINWGAQCTLFLGSDPEMVKLAAESGCVAVFVGMESINQDVLSEMKKPFNREKNFVDQIKCFHDNGIMVNPGIIFGSDNDDESVFENTVEFLIKNHMELAYINIATPLPGTVLYERLRTQNRIFDWDWSHYDGKHVVFQPKRMTPETLQEGFFWANREFFSLGSIGRRMFHTKERLISRWIMNWRFRQLVRRTTPRGRLSPIASTLRRLQVQIPSLNAERLIPNALNAVKSSVQGAATQIDRYIRIKPIKLENLRGLMIDLEGTLDRANVAEVRRRIKKAVKKARFEIVINFEHLRYAAPEALASLLEWLRSLTPGVSVRVMNLKASFRETVDHLALAGLEISKEELLTAPDR